MTSGLGLQPPGDGSATQFVRSDQHLPAVDEQSHVPHP
ncbi:hypothetical protein HDA40_002713 [Hamadaea flava]|nr:hypothetical protein [Hamadaea flava]